MLGTVCRPPSPTPGARQGMGPRVDKRDSGVSGAGRAGRRTVELGRGPGRGGEAYAKGSEPLGSQRPWERHSWQG